MKILHPFSKVSNPEEEILGAEGYYLDLIDGTRMDIISGIYNTPLGYSARSIKEEMYKALQRLPTAHIFSATPDVSQSHFYANDLSTTLSNLVPFGKSIFFTNSGSEAMDSAITLCKLRADSKRTVVLSYTSSYHGSTSNMLAASGNLAKNTQTNQFIDFYYFYDQRTIAEYLEYVENRIIEIGPETILAFIAEPMIGASGGFFMKDNVLPGLKAILEKYGILLILDEVISGFGRLGTMFAFERYNVQPDVLILSKAMTNGYMPMACCITSFDVDAESVSFGFSTAAHPVACAAALESIRLIEMCLTYNVGRLHSSVMQMFKQYRIYDHCYTIDSEGLFFALHFSKESSRYVQHDVAENIGGRFTKQMRERGFITRGNPKSLILSPGYLMTDDMMDSVISNLAEVIRVQH
jgi:adenosylmethionine-8-amino-7-oxononanoate aminotransferase